MEDPTQFDIENEHIENQHEEIEYDENVVDDNNSEEGEGDEEEYESEEEDDDEESNDDEEHPVDGNVVTQKNEKVGMVKKFVVDAAVKSKDKLVETSGWVSNKYNEHPSTLNVSLMEHTSTMFRKVLIYFWTLLGTFLHTVCPPLASKFCVYTEKKELSNYEKVRKFTVAAGTNCSSTPTPISMERGKFLLEMVFSELHEFALQLDGITSSEEAYELMRECIGKDRHEYHKCSKLERIAEQADALVDAWVYMLNVAAEHGQDLSKVFDIVMESNMAKIDPTTGMCKRRETDGKIMKPEGWTPPDIVSEIYRQSTQSENQ